MQEMVPTPLFWYGDLKSTAWILAMLGLCEEQTLHCSLDTVKKSQRADRSFSFFLCRP